MCYLLAGVSGGNGGANQEANTARHIWQWRNLMEFFLMRHHSTCIGFLDPSGRAPGKYDVVGVNRRPKPKNHFSGAPFPSDWAVQGDL